MCAPAATIEPRKAVTARRKVSRAGFTLIELLIVVVIIGILAAIAIPKFAATKEKAYMAKMKGDLRNLMTAQEAYSADFMSYYGGPVPNPVLAYTPSSSAIIAIVQAVPGGWSANITMPTVSAKTCSVFLGSAAPIAPAVTEGLIACT